MYCHTKHRFDLLDMEFFEQLDACGLACTEVGGAGGWLGLPAFQELCAVAASCNGAGFKHGFASPLALALPPLKSGMQVWEPGVPPAPESPPLSFPPADLFPEQRIAVYRITKRPDAAEGSAAEQQAG